MIRRITDGVTEYGLIVPANYCSDEGIEWIVPNDYMLQLGLMSRKQGYKVKPHRHFAHKLPSMGTVQEILIVRKGAIQVSFLNRSGGLVASVTAEEGDTIMFIQGGHAVEMLEDAQIMEVKLGPFTGDDKEYFNHD